MANSADFVRLGPEAKVDLAGLPFACTGGDYEVIRDVVKRTDTESLAVRSKASTLRQIRVNLRLQQSDDGGYHAAPLSLTTGESVPCDIWPAGRGDPAGPVSIPDLIVGSFQSSFEVQGSAVQSVRISGESDNSFDLPGE